MVSKAMARRLRGVLKEPYLGTLFGSAGSPEGRNGRYCWLRHEDLVELLKLAEIKP